MLGLLAVVALLAVLFLVLRPTGGRETASATVAEVAPAPAVGQPEFGEAARGFLLALARRSLTAAVTESRTLELPTDTPAALRQPRGVFVTLEIAGELRGCIGHIFPTEPLALAVIHNARHAALDDHRFSPVAVDELDRIAIELSVLGRPTPLPFSSPDELLHKLRPGRDGVVLDIAGRRSTFLPQVWEQLPDPTDFLDHLARKGGSTSRAWRGPSVTVLTYSVEAFAESGSGSE